MGTIVGFCGTKERWKKDSRGRGQRDSMVFGALALLLADPSLVP